MSRYSPSELNQIMYFFFPMYTLTNAFLLQKLFGYELARVY
jgi:hypothetical protein